MFVLFEFCCGTPPSCLKGGWWVVVVLAQGPLVLGFWVLGFGPGLDNISRKEDKLEKLKFI